MTFVNLLSILKILWILRTGKESWGRHPFFITKPSNFSSPSLTWKLYSSFALFSCILALYHIGVTTISCFLLREGSLILVEITSVGIDVAVEPSSTTAAALRSSRTSTDAVGSSFTPAVAPGTPRTSAVAEVSSPTSVVAPGTSHTTAVAVVSSLTSAVAPGTSRNSAVAIASSRTSVVAVGTSLTSAVSPGT